MRRAITKPKATDNEALAVLFGRYRRHGHEVFSLPRGPDRPALIHAIERGWLWGYDGHVTADGVKALVMENRKSDDPSHSLFFVKAPDRRQGGQGRGSGRRAPAAPLTSPRPSQPQRNGFQTHAGANDDVPPWER
jgi:hypothetical protein